MGKGKKDKKKQGRFAEASREGAGKDISGYSVQLERQFQVWVWDHLEFLLILRAVGWRVFYVNAEESMVVFVKGYQS